MRQPSTIAPAYPRGQLASAAVPREEGLGWDMDNPGRSDSINDIYLTPGPRSALPSLLCFLILSQRAVESARACNAKTQMWPLGAGVRVPIAHAAAAACSSPASLADLSSRAVDGRSAGVVGPPLLAGLARRPNGASSAATARILESPAVSFHVEPPASFKTEAVDME